MSMPHAELSKYNPWELWLTVGRNFKWSNKAPILEEETIWDEKLEEPRDLSLSRGNIHDLEG